MRSCHRLLLDMQVEVKRAEPRDKSAPPANKPGVGNGQPSNVAYNNVQPGVLPHCGGNGVAPPNVQPQPPQATWWPTPPVAQPGPVAPGHPYAGWPVTGPQPTPYGAAWTPTPPGYHPTAPPTAAGYHHPPNAGPAQWPHGYAPPQPPPPPFPSQPQAGAPYQYQPGPYGKCVQMSYKKRFEHVS